MTLLLYIVHAFVELTQDLFAVPGLSKGLCQDPLKVSFGEQRAAGGRNKNPTIQQFWYNNTVTLTVQRSAALEPVRGNCRNTPGLVDCSDCSSALSDETPLPKRSRKAKKY